MKEFTKANELIKAAKTIAIVGHKQPDGDCVGSALALKMTLENMGKTADVFFESKDIPSQFSYLKGFDKICTEMPAGNNFDLLVILDTSTEDRIGFAALRDQSKTVLCIDHHIGTSIKADCVLANSDRASCGELIHEFFTAQNIKITPDIANALYASITFDTGYFIHSNTTAYTHQVTKELIDLGADINFVNNHNIQHIRAYDKALIPGIVCVLRNLRFFCDGQIAVSYLDNRRAIFSSEHRDKLKHYVSDVKGASASIFFTREKNGDYRISMRSNGSDINVGAIAKALGGGGHKNASGVTLRGSYKKILNHLVTEIAKQI